MIYSYESIFFKTQNMMKSRLIGLKDPTNGIDDENMVGLISKDEKKFYFSLDEVNEMYIIRQQIRSSGNDNYINVPKVSGAMFENIKAFFLNNNIAFDEMNDDEFFDLLSGAITVGFLRLVKYLIPEWADNRPFPGRPYRMGVANNLFIRLAAEIGHKKAVKLLLTQAEVDPSAKDNAAIKFAAKLGHSKVVKLLLKDERVDPSAENNAAIQFAAQRGHSEVVEILLKDKRVDIEKLEPYLENEDIESIYDRYVQKKKQKTKQTETYTYENKIELYWFVNTPQTRRSSRLSKSARSSMQQAMEYQLRNVNYTVSNPSDWDEIRQQEVDAVAHLNAFTNEELGSDASIQIKNISQLNLPFQIFSKIQSLSKPNYAMNTFLATNTRRQLNEEGKVTSTAILTGILFTLESDAVYIEYITRFYQGCAFQFEIEEKECDTYEKFNEEVGDLFSFVISQLKNIGDPKTIRIQLVSEGSIQLIQKHLLQKYFKLWHKEPGTVLGWQTFPLKYLEFQMCSQCVDYISAVKWENQDRYSFCSEECARLKWKSINATQFATERE